MSNRTGVIYASQSFGQEQDDEDYESTEQSGGVATTCGGVLDRDNLGNGVARPHSENFSYFF